MTPDEVAALIRGQGFGIVSLSANDRGYGIPLFYGYDGRTFYFQSRPGLKDEFLGATREACLTIVRMDSPDDWQSVQAVGPVRRVTKEQERLRATEILMQAPFPPEFGVLAAGRPRRSAQSLFLWSLTPVRLVGRKSETMLTHGDEEFA